MSAGSGPSRRVPLLFGPVRAVLLAYAGGGGVAVGFLLVALLVTPVRSIIEQSVVEPLLQIGAPAPESLEPTSAAKLSEQDKHDALARALVELAEAPPEPDRTEAFLPLLLDVSASSDVSLIPQDDRVLLAATSGFESDVVWPQAVPNDGMVVFDEVDESFAAEPLLAIIVEVAALEPALVDPTASLLTTVPEPGPWAQPPPTRGPEAGRAARRVAVAPPASPTLAGMLPLNMGVVPTVGADDAPAGSGAPRASRTPTLPGVNVSAPPTTATVGVAGITRTNGRADRALTVSQSAAIAPPTATPMLRQSR